MVDPLQSQNFFSQGSPYLEHPLLTPERTAKEVDFVLARCGLAPGARILDVGCGPGRHVIELARRGYEVVGLDPSEAMIAAARKRSAEAGVFPDFLQMRGEDLAFQSCFDAVLCLFTTLGQMTEVEDNRALILRAHRALRPHGWFVVEVPQRAWIENNLKESERFGSGDHYTKVSRRYDPTDSVVTEVFEVVSPQETRRYMLLYRVFSREAMKELLEQARFRILEALGAYESTPLQLDDAIMLFFARKGGR